MQLRNRKKFLSDVITQEQKKLQNKDHKPCYTGKDVHRYRLDYGGLLAWVNREAQSGGCWDLAVHTSNPKIIVRQIGAAPVCALDTRGYHCLNTVFMITPRIPASAPDLRFVLACLNSKFLQDYWKANFQDMRRTVPKIKGTYLEKLPIPTIEKANAKRTELYKTILNLVDQMIAAQSSALSAVSDSDQKLNSQRIALLENQIDANVSALYGNNGAG